MIWKSLGFTRDVFFVEPIGPNKEDIDLFVGRDDEIKKFAIDTFGGKRALKIVSGELGVGKTSFVNACQYFSYMKRFPVSLPFEPPSLLPCIQKLQIREAGSIEDFHYQVIASICRSIDMHCRFQQIDPPKAVSEILSYFQDLATTSANGGLNLGLTVAGFGASVGGARQSKTQNIIRNPRLHLEKLLEITQTELGFSGVFVLVNNLDILSKDRLLSFFNEARDELFDIQGIYWTLIGRKGIGSIIETEVDRVADYLTGTESCIEPLNFSSTLEIINKRVESFRLNESLRCPFSDETILAFYSLSLQELRETLKICGEVVRRVLASGSFHDQIPHKLAIQHFVEYAHDRAKDLDLSESHKRVLNAVWEKRSCRPKDFERFGYKTTQGFIQALKGLVKKRLLSVVEKGRARYYRMTGMTALAALTGALGDEIEKAAYENLRQNQIGLNRTDKFGEAQMSLNLDDNNY